MVSPYKAHLQFYACSDPSGTLCIADAEFISAVAFFSPFFFFLGGLFVLVLLVILILVLWKFVKPVEVMKLLGRSKKWQGSKTDEFGKVNNFLN
jgi:hypothetical protein